MSAGIFKDEMMMPRFAYEQYRRISFKPLLHYLTPIGGRGPRLLWLLCAEGSESMLALSPLPALALALPVRLRTFLRPLG